MINKAKMGKGELYFDFIDLLGEDITNQLIKTFPGIPVYIPKHVREDHPIARAIGKDAMEKLCEVYCGETITIPKGDHLSISRRNADIYDRAARGESPAKIARRYKICYRTVLNIIAREREKRAQLTLL